jgi:hypothetical protein
MANQESKPAYKDHLTAWRPDYPMVWNLVHGKRIYDYESMSVAMSAKERVLNVRAFVTARDAIAKCIGQC